MYWLVLAVFFLSGASALLFETVWFRLAGLGLGNSVWASSLVLASFMAGLALGNLVVARFGRRLARPLLAYAVLELVIAGSGFALVLLLPALTPLLAGAFRPFLDQPLALNSLRLGIAFPLLLVPSTAMGATLPLLVRTLLSRDPNFGRVLGRLYGLNTLGAVAGALLGELALIDLLGVRGTGLAAATLNVLAAAAVLAVPRRLHPRAPSPEPSHLADLLRPRAAAALAAALLSGGLLLAMEVIWFRFLLLFVFGTSLAFAVMLAVVLLGIGLGGLLASGLLGARDTAFRLAPATAMLAGASVAAGYVFYRDGFGVLQPEAMVAVSSGSGIFWLTLGLTLPTSVLSGVLFTLLGRALREHVSDETVATAAVTLANTAGAMLGSLLAGLALLPLLGMEKSFFWLALGYGGVALASAAALATETAPPRSPSRLTTLVAGALFALFLLGFPFGLMERHYVPLVTRAYTADGSRIVAMREGRTETAVYLRKDLWNQPRYYRLVTNGHSMSSSHLGSQRYMSLYVHWPLALRPDTRHALLISYGVGITAKTLTEQPDLETIDVVDISREILQLSREVGMHGDEHPLKDPRVRIHVEDGRFFLQTSESRFDLITGEPPPPKYAGIVNLYAREYFQLLRARLSEGGLVTYWLPVLQLSPTESRAIARGFCDAFPDCTLWTGFHADWMLAGSRNLRGAPDQADFTRQWRQPANARRLAAIGVERPELLGATFLADAEQLKEWIGDTPPLVDDRPYRLSPRHRYPEQLPEAAKAEYRVFMDAAAARSRFERSAWVGAHWPSELRLRTLDSFRWQEMLNLAFAGNPTDSSALYQVLTESDLRAVPLLLSISDDQEQAIAERATAAGIADPELSYLRAIRALSERRYDEAVTELDAALAHEPGDPALQRYRILALVLAGDRSTAATAADRLRAHEPAARTPRFWSWLETALASPGNPGAAGGAR